MIALLDELQIEELEDFNVNEYMFDNWEDQWESITETSEFDWSGVDFDF